MGNSNPVSQFNDMLVFSPKQVQGAIDQQIKSIYIDNQQLPLSGLIIVGNDWVQNYSEKGDKLSAQYKSSQKIIASAYNSLTSLNFTIVAIACVDHNIYLLNSKTLQLVDKIVVTFYPADIQLYQNSDKSPQGGSPQQGPNSEQNQIDSPNQQNSTKTNPQVEVTCFESSYFSTFRIDAINSPLSNSIIVGLSTGFLKQYSLTSLMKLKTFNPLQFEIMKNDKIKQIAIENTMISGVQSILYGNISEIIFVNHKLQFNNCLNRSLTLDESLICMYKANGENLKKLHGMKGEIMAACVLENRTNYVALSSISSQIYIWNFFTGSLVLKVALDLSKDKTFGNSPSFFSVMTIHEFEMNQRFMNVAKVYSDANSKAKKQQTQSVDKPKDKIEVIDGDIIFTINTNGCLLTSKITYDEKISCLPLKILNIQGKDNNVQQSIAKNIQSKYISSMLYDKYLDKLYFADQQDQVRIFSNMVKNSLTF